MFARVCEVQALGAGKREGGKRAQPLEGVPCTWGILLCMFLVLHGELGVGWVPGNESYRRTTTNNTKIKCRKAASQGGGCLRWPHAGSRGTGDCLMALGEAGRITWQFLALQGREEAS